MSLIQFFYLLISVAVVFNKLNELFSDGRFQFSN